MGYYLNSKQAYDLYKSEADSLYFVDKSLLLEELFPLVKNGNKHVCIIRPRRFGKSVMAAMVGSFFGKGYESSSIFDSLMIAQKSEKDYEEKYDYREFMNHYNVIYINFIEPANVSKSYDEFIHRVERMLKRDFRQGFPNVDFLDDAVPQEDLTLIYEETGEKFIIVMDEWDCIFHKNYTTNEDKQRFINWLAALTKDKAYVALSYMTGILPIAKYSSGSTINHFDEYMMSVQPKYSEYFGFTDEEVDMLYERYMRRTKTHSIAREDLRLWYDGYNTAGGKKLYNPRSVVKALSNDCLASYWTTSGAYGEVAKYIKNDHADIRKDVSLMVAGESVTADVEEYSATSMQLTTRNELFSAMVVYGFLDYENGKVRIPNRELMDEFARIIREREDMGYIHRLAMESERMLEATLKGDTKIMAEILQFAHNTEVPLLSYNNETELTAIVNLVYLSARDKYIVEREDKAGLGYVDFVFYPVNPIEDGIILELKVNSTPEKALQQIKDKEYALKFVGRMADKNQRVNCVRLVGIGYSKKTKKHRCKIEVVNL